jgi:hypothetical protein
MNQLRSLPWPREIPRVFRPLATFSPKVEPHKLPDLYSLMDARRRRREQHEMGGLTQSYSELFFANAADYTAFNTSSSEGSLLAGVNKQPIIPALFLAGNQAVGKTFRFEASGVLGTTSTPTIIFQCRLGTTLGSSYLSGTSVGVTAAITTASGVSNKWWYLCLDLACYTPGIGSTNCTLSGAGYVMCPGGFASPFFYPLEPTTPDTATWTAAIDGSVTQYFNLSVTWSASSSSNTITCKNLRAGCLN